MRLHILNKTASQVRCPAPGTPRGDTWCPPVTPADANFDYLVQVQLDPHPQPQRPTASRGAGGNPGEEPEDRMVFNRLLTDGLWFGRETERLSWCCPVPDPGHGSWQMKMPFQCPSRWRWGRLAPTCAATLPDRSLSTDCPIVTNSSSLGHTLSRVWRLSRFLQGPVEEESAPWKWGAHPSSPEAPWAWQWATETPSSLQFRGPHHQLPQNAQHPWDELEALFPVAPLLFCSLSGSLSVPRTSTMWKPRGRPALS